MARAPAVPFVETEVSLQPTLVQPGLGQRRLVVRHPDEVIGFLDDIFATISRRQPMASTVAPGTSGTSSSAGGP